MSQYFETFKACGMKSGTDAIRQEIQKKDQKAKRGLLLQNNIHQNWLGMKKRRNTKGDAVVPNHHAICGMLEEIAHKQRKLMRQAKKVKDNVKIVPKRTLLCDEKKGVAWNAKKGRLKANSAIQTQST
ncbi:unnamed protein product [Cylicocyclus nassatus]|uniref:Uncharacterized protein n=1 Tax=Cylicocyclus nassatus TaxID=53992 RepID=A0AA36GYT4_CYLNA|nr:unnamed protein product [Cylicocyclus nassatus]